MDERSKVTEWDGEGLQRRQQTPAPFLAVHFLSLQFIWSNKIHQCHPSMMCCNLKFIKLGLF